MDPNPTKIVIFQLCFSTNFRIGKRNSAEVIKKPRLTIRTP